MQFQCSCETPLMKERLLRKLWFCSNKCQIQLCSVWWIREENSQVSLHISGDFQVKWAMCCNTLTRGKKSRIFDAGLRTDSAAFKKLSCDKVCVAFVNPNPIYSHVKSSVRKSLILTSSDFSDRIFRYRTSNQFHFQYIYLGTS